MFNFILCALAVCMAPDAVWGHTYHLGGCPTVEPMSSFNMNNMLGIWYVIQKTSTASNCIAYNFTRGEEPGEFTIQQVSQHPVLGLTPVDHQYRYEGILSVPDQSVPAKMRVRFPLSVAGDASYTVFHTDYENYAGIFTCQKILLSNRQSVSILSRTKTLDEMYLNKLRAKLQTFNINPYDLSIISQKDCPAPASTDGYNINIDKDTFSAKSAAGVIKKIGEKLGDGVEYISDGAKKIYHRVADSDSKEEVDKSNLKSKNPNAEWLP